MILASKSNLRAGSLTSLSVSGGGSNSANDTHSVPDLGGNRVAVPSQDFGDTIPMKTRRELGLDGPQIERMGISDLLHTLADAHPDMSFAIWNFNRMANSGYHILVRDKETRENVPEYVDLVEDFISQLSEPNMDQFQLSKSFDKVVNQLIQSVVLSGAAALEAVPVSGNKAIAFLAPIDPYSIEFKVMNDRMVPTQNDGEIILDIPNFFYEGLDEFIDNPYGRSPVIGAINTIMFQLQVLSDLKAVVHNQGYPRFDITLLEELLLKRMPPAIRNNEEKKQKWLMNQLESVKSMFESLKPDDSFVHMDSVTISSAGGGKNGTIIDPEKLMHVIDNQIMGGLKTLSTILGRRTTGNTESFAKIEVKLYTKGVEAIQTVVKRVLDKALTMVLNLQGVQGIVDFKFNPIDIRTEVEIAQFEQIRIQNAIQKRDQGWITQDDAALEIVGHEAVSDVIDRSSETDSKPTISSPDERPDDDVNGTDTDSPDDTNDDEGGSSD